MFHGFLAPENRVLGFSAKYRNFRYDIFTMPEKVRKPRSKHSYRDRIREVIRHRIYRGDPLRTYEIIDEAGGGSASTVQQELKAMLEGDTVKPAVLVGADQRTPTQRIGALEKAINEGIAREQVLIAENAALKESLQAARSDLDKLLVAHQDSQRLLLQGVDDLRQMVRAGKDTLPAGVMEAERQKIAAQHQSNDGVLWKAKHDQLLRRYIELEARNRKLEGRLHELGQDAD